MEVSYSSFRVKTETDSLLLGRWEKWKSRGSCGISKRSGKVLPLDFSAERLFPPPFYPRIVLETHFYIHACNGGVYPPTLLLGEPEPRVCGEWRTRMNVRKRQRRHS